MKACGDREEGSASHGRRQTQPTRHTATLHLCCAMLTACKSTQQNHNVEIIFLKIIDKYIRWNIAKLQKKPVMCVHVRASLCMWMCLCECVCVCVYLCMCTCTCVCMPVSVQSACVSVHVGTLARTKHMWMHVCVWRTLGKVIWKHHHLQHTSLTLYLLPAGTTLLRRAGTGDDHLTHLADIWTWNNTNTSSSAYCPWQLWFTQHNHQSVNRPIPSHQYVIGLVVKVPAWTAEDPGFKSRLGQRKFDLRLLFQCDSM